MIFNKIYRIKGMGFEGMLGYWLLVIGYWLLVIGY
jgi:hypothetical protein